jgi:hypothetical protein
MYQWSAGSSEEVKRKRGRYGTQEGIEQSREAWPRPPCWSWSRTSSSWGWDQKSHCFGALLGLSASQRIYCHSSHPTSSRSLLKMPGGFTAGGMCTHTHTHTHTHTCICTFKCVLHSMSSLHNVYAEDTTGKLTCVFNCWEGLYELRW